MKRAFLNSVLLGAAALLASCDREDLVSLETPGVYPTRTQPAAAVVVSPEIKLTADDGASRDAFGVSASMDGDRAIIGAQLDDDAGGESGSAYVFRRDAAGWVEEAKLTAGDATPGAAFGRSVWIEGDLAVVGAFRDSDRGPLAGSAYVFRRAGMEWSEEAKLTASDAAAGDGFGIAVSLDGNKIIVGAWLDGDGAETGSAYVFGWDGTTWNEAAKLTASDGGAGDRLGFDVAIDGSRALVGAPHHDEGGSNAGSAYAFGFDGANWVEQAKLTASDAVAEARFGGRVALEGDRAVVGAFTDDDAGMFSGSAYAFDLRGLEWTETAKIVAGDAEADDRFGSGLSLEGDRLVVGAVGDNEGAGNSGSAYIFEFDGLDWIEETKLTATTPTASASFGGAVFLSGNDVIVGSAFASDDGGIQTGAAYVYTVEGPADAVSGLIEEVTDLVSDGALNPGQGNALGAKLNAALRQIDRGNITAGINQLQAFINQVTALISSGTLTPDEGQPLIDAAQAVVDTLRESAGSSGPIVQIEAGEDHEMIRGEAALTGRYHSGRRIP